jgi:hypothetical protein
MLCAHIIADATISRRAGCRWRRPGLIRSAPWARPLAISLALLLIIAAAAFIVPNIGSIGGYGPTLIDPLFWLLGAAGLVLLSLVAKPFRSA